MLDASSPLGAIPCYDGPLAPFAAAAGAPAAGGTWRQYVRQYVLATPKELLRLRSQVARGKARVKVRARAKTPRPIEWLFSPNLPNELCWRVLEYWNPRTGAAHFEGLLRGNPDAQREVAAAAGPAPTV